MRNCHVITILGYKAIYYRDMGYEVSWETYVFLKQVIILYLGLFQKERIYQQHMAIWGSFDKGNDNHESNFEVSPYFQTNPPI